MSFLAVALWGAVLAGAVFYSQEARHPGIKPLAAFAIFMTVFSLAAAAIFALLTAILGGLKQTERLEEPLWIGLFLAAVFLPAFLLARRQIKKAPRAPRFSQRMSGND